MKQKPMTEDQTRKRIMSYAREIGAEDDLRHIFAKWDVLISKVSDNEREDMAKCAILEIQSLLDIYAEKADGLTINGQVIIPASK